MAYDSKGNLIFAKGYSKFGFASIESICPSGRITHIAGSRSCAAQEGFSYPNRNHHPIPHSDARFGRIESICISNDDFIYMAEGKMDQILKIDPQGVRLLAGSGINGFNDGPSLYASFNHPSGICISNSGTIYISDEFNHRIRMIENDVVSTLAGNGGIMDWLDNSSLISSSFNRPHGLCLSPRGSTLYICDSGNHRIRLIDLIGSQVSTLAGNGEKMSKDGTLTTSSFCTPYHIQFIPNTSSLLIKDNGLLLRVLSCSDDSVTSIKLPNNIEPDCFVVSSTGDLIVHSHSDLYSISSTIDKEKKNPTESMILKEKQGTVTMMREPIKPHFTRSSYMGFDQKIYNYYLTPNADRLIIVGDEGIIVDKSLNRDFVGGATLPSIVPSPTGPYHFYSHTNDSCLFSIAEYIDIYAGDRLKKGRVDGTRRNAFFTRIQDICATPQNHIFICEANRPFLRVISPLGMVTTLFASEASNNIVNNSIDQIAFSANLNAILYTVNQPDRMMIGMLNIGGVDFYGSNTSRRWLTEGVGLKTPRDAKMIIDSTGSLLLADQYRTISSNNIEEHLRKHCAMSLSSL